MPMLTLYSSTLAAHQLERPVDSSASFYPFSVNMSLVARNINGALASPDEMLAMTPRSARFAPIVSSYVSALNMTVAGAVDFLPIDMTEDAEFYEKCLKPLIDKLRASGYFKFHKRTRRGDADTGANYASAATHRQGAWHQLVEYIGPDVDIEATRRLRAEQRAAADLEKQVAVGDEHSTKDASKKEEPPLPPLDEFEIDKAHGGVIALVRLPYARTRTIDREIETHLARAVAEQRFSEVVRLSGARARQLFFSVASETLTFDRGTMRSLVVNSHIMARKLNILPPYSLAYAFSSAGLVFGTHTLFQEVTTRQSIDEQVLLNHIDFDLLGFYAETLRNDEFVRSIGYAVAVVDQRLQERAASEADDLRMFLDEMAAEEAGSAGVPTPDLANVQDLVDDDPSVAGSRVDDVEKQSAGAEERKEKRRKKARKFTDNDIASIVSIERSLNSRLSTAGPSSTASGVITRTRMPNGELGFRRTPYRAITHFEHEFADRLRSTRFARVPITSVVEADLCGVDARPVRLPPLRLVRRFTLAFACALRLVDTYLRYAYDSWNVLDYFYLHMLAEIEMRSRDWRDTRRVDEESGAADGRPVIVLSEATRKAIAELVEVNRQRRAQRKPPLALAGTGVNSLSELVSRVIDTVMRPAPTAADGEILQYTPPSPAVNPLQVNLDAMFSPRFSLHTVFDTYQTQSSQTPRQRRTHAMFTRATIVPQSELDAFITRNALVGMRARLDAMLAAMPHEPPTYRVLRFDAYDCQGRITPMALWSTLRSYGARDGDNALVVWTPATLPPAGNGAFYVAMRVGVWRRIVDATLPAIVVEQRSLGRVCRNYTLMAPALLRALESPDAETVADALGAVQALLTRAPARLPFQWSTVAENGRIGANGLRGSRHAVRALRAVASAVMQRGGSDVDADRAQCGAELLRSLHAPNLQATREASIFTALQAALAGDAVFMYMNTERAQQFVNEGPALEPNVTTPHEDLADLNKLRLILQQQIAASRATSSSSETVVTPPAGVVADESTTACRCGAEAPQCARLARALAVRFGVQRNENRLARGAVTIECCICARVNLGDRARFDPLTGRRKRIYEYDELGKRVATRPSDYDTPEERATAAQLEQALRGDQPAPPRRRMKLMPTSMCESCEARTIVASATAGARGRCVPIFDPVASTAFEGSIRTHALPPDRIVELLARPSCRQYLYALRVGTRARLVCKTLLPHDVPEITSVVDPTMPAVDRRSLASDSDGNRRRASTPVADIVETTRQYADARLIAGDAEVDAAIERAGGGRANDLLALLVQLEMLALVNRDALEKRVSTMSAAALGAHLNVLTDRQLTALRVDAAEFDGNGIVANAADGGGYTLLFPVCPPVLVESTGIWRRTAAGDSLLRPHERLERMLYAGRTPRPASSLPSAFMELVFGNWYDVDGQRDDATVDEAAEAAEELAAARADGVHTFNVDDDGDNAPAPMD